MFANEFFSVLKQIHPNYQHFTQFISLILRLLYAVMLLETIKTVPLPNWILLGEKEKPEEKTPFDK